ncbi:creatininase [Nesterenkonia sp. PF2B19]|uniref:creatininase n=1 Tax=unclassified Nesterenkonia TaxID=2629769 RepID=UPI0009F1DDF3|nr:creatininase [Nesterenkonia sp. PF2B19]OSM44035.1 creatininase [Nesterenkonia sp. PF2B19]
MTSDHRAAQAEPAEVHLAMMDAVSWRRWATQPGSTVLIPVGALEQHGPHLPLGTDALLADRIAAGVAEGTAMRVAPALTYGYKSQQRSGGGDHLPGTTSLDATSLIAMTRDLARSFLQQGVAHVVLVNGHYENYQFLYEGVDLALRDLGAGRREDQAALLLSYWDYVSATTLETVYPDGFPGWDVEHGGVLETSLMLHIDPSKVRLDLAPDHPAAQLPRFDRLPVVEARTPASGCLSSPSGSDAAKGRLLFDQVVEALRTDLVEELALPDSR